MELNIFSTEYFTLDFRRFGRKVHLIFIFSGYHIIMKVDLNYVWPLGMSWTIHMLFQTEIILWVFQLGPEL